MGKSVGEFYYLRLCRKNWVPLEEYIGKDGVIQSRDRPGKLMRFSSRDAAVAFVEQNAHRYPDRAIQILLHVGGRPYTESRDPDED